MTMAERLLIVNADDYNTGPERNRGIIEAAQTGIVTSASVLTNTAGLDSALAALSQELGPHVGVHLNLTSGRPLAPGVQSLTGQGAAFLAKHAAWRRALSGGYDLDDLRREWSAQIEAFCRSGLQPDHLDGNNHLHIFPGCARICAELAVRFKIRCARLPLEPLLAPGLCGPGGVKRLFITLLAVRARSLFRASGLCMPERMFGIAFPRPGDPAALRLFLKKLPAGTSELMCHPGYRASDSHAFASGERELELRVLTSPDVRKIIADEGIRLLSFSDMV
jgi:predicted glycoside hydrolase/deacetylase ChbG (UPF0249 family)